MKRNGSFYPTKRSVSTGALGRPAATRFSRLRFGLLVLADAWPPVTAMLYMVLPLAEGCSTWQRMLVMVI